VTTKAILIRLSRSLVEQLDEAASVLNMTRVDVIRRSLMRDLQFVGSEELKRTRRHQENLEKRYLEWAALKAKIALLAK
jgi:predicted transcriptional regulator